MYTYIYTSGLTLTPYLYPKVAVGDGSVGVKSASRVGDSDLGVNAKRLNFIAAALRAKGWDAANVA